MRNSAASRVTRSGEGPAPAPAPAPGTRTRIGTGIGTGTSTGTRRQLVANRDRFDASGRVPAE
ncbi:hypothetical protein QT381_13860 [Galbitalea sp. SE-J8]|uniref:hypothetical protein n=1 Tax=Galbitalea sp. SE-J8 TaxID=3054952 RepID=UPI00259CBEE0|nr:hypothetical protein [Galbitalea sp. SE-J8]MDM4764093.1 hypothetical protein [Galbitalea sp. SE-J8]